jgi:superfamily II DNA or RNA helicase/diadenosine tetraphosphate (Ap4A) HIT family hydrolase
VLGLWDAFPVAQGHALLVTRRHIASWFDSTSDEQRELLEALTVAKREIEASRAPDGYNIGINIGPAAGQTVVHLHIHVIPRYAGDVADPRGGVRHVIPLRANYLHSASDPLSGQEAVPHRRPLIRGADLDPLLLHLRGHLDRAERLDIAAAFTMNSGVSLLEEHLRDLLDRRGRVRIVTGDYLGVTEPQALLRLLDLQGDIQIRVLESGNVSFHPKAWILFDREGGGTAFVGSSNFSASALRGGIEWNYRVITPQDSLGFAEIIRAFDELFEDKRCCAIDAEWVRGYERRRQQAPPAKSGTDELQPRPPEPHRIQQAALCALEETRAEGNTAGLVVLATGLGKTWLSAFDSHRPEFERILFVAHREEILTQAMRTFRAIRPGATFGYYTGEQKHLGVDVLFASIQTLGRERHLTRFDPREFDYVVIDEFHHAAAGTYRRLIGYLEPKFLLGLTATPERTDGADLLALCGDNLVYRKDVADGIRAQLLCPFAYFGVPDLVDYENIPWRGARFDEEELTNHVATRARAQNALEQLRAHGGAKTIGFCVSQRHADFMADYSRSAGLRSVAVHAGPSSAPRAHSLEQLQAGDLDIVFAVDMFNEGVDLPDVDTILMLRPTESRILWLQQFGRGLRHKVGKILKVVDYIGNHRVFLSKTRALLNLGDSNRDIAFALDQYEAGALDLPPGCSVTYDLEAIQILRALVRPTGMGEALESFYRDFRDRVGRRPLALEALSEGWNPGSARQHYGSWLDFVAGMGDLTPEQTQVWQTLAPFLRELEVTQMTKSYKMVLLLAMLGEDTFPGGIDIERLTERFTEMGRRYASVRNETAFLGNALELRQMLERNPIAAWTEGKGTGGVAYFNYDGRRFATAPPLDVPATLRIAAQDLVWEVAEWRLVAYLRRPTLDRLTDRIVCSVSHASGRPILFLPDRARNAGIPDGWVEIEADNKLLQANFVKVAVNVITTRDSLAQNLLPEILQRWFGPDAGQPGRADRVVFERHEDRYTMMPLTSDSVAGPKRWARYKRDEAAKASGFEFKGMEDQSGIVQRPGAIYLFVTLDKKEAPAAHKYRDQFLSATEFEWQSQNRTRQESSLGQDLHNHRERKVDIHLFVRRAKKVAGKTSPFIYCGHLEFKRWEGDKPITVWWELEEAVPREMWEELSVPGA